MAAKKKKKKAHASSAPKKTRVATKNPAKKRAKKKAHASSSVARTTRRNPEGCHAEANPSRRRAKRKKKRKKNPAPGELSAFTRAAIAVGVGVGAAVTGTLGDWGISKLGIQSKAAGIAANMGAAVIGGAGFGALLPAAGMILAHNFTTSAVQIALSKPRPEPSQMVKNTPFQVTGGVSPKLLQAKAPAPVGNYEQIAAEIASEHERLSGIVADTMGDQVSGYESLGSVRANMSDDALSRIQSVHAAYAGDDFGDFGDPEEIGNLDYITA